MTLLTVDYASIEGGWPCDGVEDLIGCALLSSNTFISEMTDRISTLRAVPTVLFTQDILDTEAFWKNEIMKVGEGCILSCTTPESVLWKYENPYYEGIVARHAYSITKAIEYEHRKFVV